MSDNMQQMDNERYANALYALNECIKAGLSDKALQTIRFEMGIDYRDYAILVQQNLKQERKTA